MRFKKFRLVAAVSLLVLGGLALLVGFFAFQLHLDNNSIMGNSGKFLAILGALSLIFAVWLAFSERITSSRFSRAAAHFFTQMTGSFLNSKPVKWFTARIHNYQKTTLYKCFVRNPWIYGVISAVLVIFIYFWFITGAKWA